MRAVIRIKGLSLRTVIGLNEWERNKKQDVLIHVRLEVDARRAVENDQVEGALDYKKVTKRIIAAVEGTSFHMLESLAAHVLEIVMEDPAVLSATVEVDKPHSLRFADSVSVEVSESREK